MLGPMIVLSRISILLLTMFLVGCKLNGGIETKLIGANITFYVPFERATYTYGPWGIYYSGPHVSARTDGRNLYVNGTRCASLKSGDWVNLDEPPLVRVNGYFVKC